MYIHTTQDYKFASSTTGELTSERSDSECNSNTYIAICMQYAAPDIMFINDYTLHSTFLLLTGPKKFAYAHTPLHIQ